MKNTTIITGFFFNLRNPSFALQNLLVLISLSTWNQVAEVRDYIKLSHQIHLESAGFWITLIQ